MPEVGGQVAGDDVEERGLAGAVQPEDPAPLALRDLEIDAVDRMKAAETPADPPEQEGRRGVVDLSGGLCHLPLDDSVDDRTPLPVHGSFLCAHGGYVRLGGFSDRAAEDLRRRTA